LLELPWSDVLTTNWDTLLERTPAGERPEVVRTTADLAHGRERRIIKLHGSIGTSEHFIFAEEDYRTYPTRFAAFVNTARQIFIENELCLLGFSGDDPNFLQWSGWVRDHLGESARRIYLVGALGLRHAKRKFLESRNIAPIDLAPLVADRSRNQQEAAATALFLEFLARAKPIAEHDWKPAPLSNLLVPAHGVAGYPKAGHGRGVCGVVAKPGRKHLACGP
jgi:SIR2-like domain